LRRDLVTDEADDAGGGQQPEMGERTRVDETLDRLNESDEGADEDGEHDAEPGNPLPARAAEEEREAERDRSQRIAEVVDQIRQAEDRAIDEPVRVVVCVVVLVLVVSHASNVSRWNDPVVGDRLRPLWDFDDLDGSRERFLAQLAEETTDAGRAEVLTQLARVEGLRDEFENCDAILDDAEALGGVTARSLLERGRRERSSGREGAGLAEFRRAFELAQGSGEDVLAADAAHMLALVDDAEAWTARGVELAAASDDPGVRYWLGPLYNNIGWVRFEAGDYAGALEAFELALAARERDDPRESSLQHARDAVDEARRALAGKST
jgi:tetratricopeptide (TPR) repeat protein